MHVLRTRATSAEEEHPRDRSTASMSRAGEEGGEGGTAKGGRADEEGEASENRSRVGAT